MSSFNLKIEGEVAVLEFDQPDSKVNVLDRQTMEELNGHLDRLAEISGVRALVIASKKEGIFIAGADIKEIEGIRLPGEAVQKAETGKAVLKKLSRPGLVTVAAINGACVGGGLELALACGWRVAGFSGKIRIGLPEVKLGVIPGFGGTLRLPKLIGLGRATKMILAGQLVSSKDALKYGIVDRLYSDNRLIEQAVGFAGGIVKGQIWINRRRKNSFMTWFLEETPLGRKIFFREAGKNVLKQTKGFYPAPLEAIGVLKRTYGSNRKDASQIESEAFGRLAVTDVSKNLIRVFYLSEEFKKVPWVDPNIAPVPVRKCGIVGAGVMGGGIAQLVSFYDIPVRLKDINHGALQTALKTAQGLFDYTVKKRILRKPQVDFKMGLISPTVSYGGFKNAELIIEAVVEDLGIKQKVFRELGEETGHSQAVLASNTSSLPILDISALTAQPERAVGLHFFNPVHRMPLVEVIRSSKTSDQAVATVVAFARRIGKTVIVVKDVPGFLINRILLAYMNEAGFLFGEGMPMECVDRIATGFGMPMGPIELIDEVGIDVGYKVAKILEDSYGPRMKVAPILGQVKAKGLLGKKSKTGFYLHQGKKKIPNPAVQGLVDTKSSGVPPETAAFKRMIYVMVNEAARCLEEGVVDRASTVDIGMIMGTGFPPFRGGLLRYADSAGIEKIVEDLQGLEKETGQMRFKPCEYLLKAVQQRRNFYGNV